MNGTRPEKKWLLINCSAHISVSGIPKLAFQFSQNNVSKAHPHPRQRIVE